MPLFLRLILTDNKRGFYMQNVTYKGFYISFEKNPINGSIVAMAFTDTETIKQVFYGYKYKVIKYSMYDLIDAYYDEKSPIQYHRNPTKGEINFGYGATHYATFNRSECIDKNGNIKKWFLSHRDNLRYYR
jgi:hypothetical protein